MKSKNTIIKFREFPIEWNIAKNSLDRKHAGGVGKSLKRLYTAVWRICPQGKCIEKMTNKARFARNKAEAPTRSGFKLYRRKLFGN